MRLVAGLLLPDEGQITALDINVRREPLRVQSALGYMPQRFGLYEDLTVQENLDLYADLQKPAPGRAARALRPAHEAHRPGPPSPAAWPGPCRGA